MNTALESTKLDIELRDLYAPNGKYTPEEKIAAVMAFVIMGTIKSAAKAVGIPQQTVDHWKNHSTWWTDVVEECRQKKQDELDAQYTNLIHKTIGAMADRIENGDVKLDKNGNEVKVPLSMKDLTLSMAVMFDKRQLLRGAATSRVETVSEKDRIDRLAANFKKMAQQMKDNGFDSMVINSDTTGED